MTDDNGDIIEMLREKRLERLAPTRMDGTSSCDWTTDEQVVKLAMNDKEGKRFHPCPSCGSYDRRMEDKKERFNRVYGAMRKLFEDDDNKSIHHYAMNYTSGIGIHTLVCNRCESVHKPVRVMLTIQEKEEDRRNKYRLRRIANEMMPDD